MPSREPETRDLTHEERALIEDARQKADILYEGRLLPHRSCGIALAETFGLPTRPYQALRRGGITGEGMCGSVRAGELVLGELLGDPDPAGGVTDALRAAITWYQQEAPTRLGKGRRDELICNTLTAPRGDFMGPARKKFCTNLTAEVAALTAEALIRFGPSGLRIEPLDLPEQGASENGG